MTSKKPTNPNEYELIDYLDIPMLRTEPVQNKKPVIFSQAELNVLLNCVSDIEQKVLTKKVINTKKH
ncbi:hypothetical protein [Legionella gresilensis]|uniref:hypothetical protein n=1 Tax=Legionella gresilensis TaxID=91823 RepID=UPI0010414BDE|nr:hypothetical protein [Legionella gresilensis]